MRFEPMDNMRSPGSRAEEVLEAVRRIIRAMELHSRFLAHHFGLTGPQLGVLRELAHVEGQSLSVGDLARRMHLSQATVTGIVDRLLRKGLIARERGIVDRRRVLVTLSEHGHALLSRTPPLLQTEFSRRFGELKDWEQTQLLASLQRLGDLMEAGNLPVASSFSEGPMAEVEEAGGYSDPTDVMGEPLGTEELP